MVLVVGSNDTKCDCGCLQFWVRIPLSYRVGTGALKLSQGGPGLQHNEEVSLDDDPGVSPWEAWNALRAACEYNPKVHVALEITADLPSSEALKRWLGEPIRVRIVVSLSHTLSLSLCPSVLIERA